MVLQSGYDYHFPEAHAHDYYSMNGYGHKEDHHESSHYDNGSSIQKVRPYIATPESPEHYAVANQKYAGHKDMSNGYGKQQSYHDDHYDGYSNGMHHFGANNHQGFYGQKGHGYPKPLPYGGMHQGGTANTVEYDSYYEYNKGPASEYEAGSYKYHGEGGRNSRFPPPYDQPHQNVPKQIYNWSTKGPPQWVSKAL